MAKYQRSRFFYWNATDADEAANRSPVSFQLLVNCLVCELLGSGNKEDITWRLGMQANKKCCQTRPSGNAPS